ncbi:MAG: DUF6356 family protein [Thermohalobaculum sp.]|nr:DUF6356 family protein [Thermohalobaculum sp.]
MITAARDLFVSHPRSVDESYFEHLAFAARFAALLFAAAGAALIHALLPFMFERTASRIVAKLYARTHNRGVAPH